MGGSHGPKSDQSSATGLPRDSAEDLGFGGEPAEIETPGPGWPVASDEPTQISKTPPILAPHVEPLRPAELGRDLVGGRLEHFDLQELVGGGGMGAVFRAIDTRLNRTVAIKVLPREQASDDEVVRRFRNEAQSAARLDHDNVARVYYVGEDKGLHFIAFEFIEGKNLRDLVVERGPLPVADALNYTLQVADALAHASTREVVHRDIKPSNVLITSDGHAKLVDMGLARLHHIEKSSEDLTASGVTLGTFDYISPEQARDPRSADVRSDIYSLGCTLFFMLTGRPPFPDGTVLQKLLQHQADEAPDPREFNSGVPVELVRILRRMMAKDPKARFQSPDELVGELVLLADQWGLRTGNRDSLLLKSGSEPSFFERHVVWIAPVAALLLIFAVLRLSTWVDGGPIGTPVSQNERPAPLGHSARQGETPSVANPSKVAPNIDSEIESPQPTTPPRAAIHSKSAGDPRRQEARRAPLPDESTFLPNRSDDLESVDEPSGEPITVSPGAKVPTIEFDPLSPPSEFNRSASTAGPGATVSASAADGLGFTSSGASALDAGVNDRAADGTSAPRTAPAGVLIVAPGESGASVFPTLSAACLAAETNDVIELRYQGRGDERPLDVRNKRLTIRAGQGFQPIVSFRPREIDPQRQSRDMVLVTGGRLTLINLAVELDLPRDMPSDGWSLIHLSQAEGLQLERCTLTVRNSARGGSPLHEDVAILRVSGPAGGSMMSNTLEPEAEPLAIQLRDCLVRGEANFLAQEEARPFHLTWNNGLASVSGYFLVSESARQMPAARDRLRIDLSHLTIDARAGLCKFSNSADAPYQLLAELRVSNSILLGQEKNPMIVQSGVDTVSELRGRFKWDGNRNFYDGYKIFWRINGRDTRDEPQLVELPGWMSFLRGEKTWGRVIWNGLPNDSRPPHTLAPGDYALDELATNNAAVKGASDGTDVGCDLRAIPEPPATPEEFSRTRTARRSYALTLDGIR